MPSTGVLMARPSLYLGAVLCPWSSQVLCFFLIFMASRGLFPPLSRPCPGSSTWETLSGSWKPVSPPSCLHTAWGPSKQSVSLGAQSDLPELGQLRPQMS